MRHATAGDDVIKNLFKVCCGILNINLRQRGLNQVRDDLLQSYLDSINFEIQDNDLLLLNQLTTIKRLVNRPSFSINERQIAFIHHRFTNMFH